MEKIDNEKCQEIKQMHSSAMAERSKYLPLFNSISKFCRNDKGGLFPNINSESKKTDEEINDATAVTAINQVSDSMMGILLGDGNFFKLKPNQNLMMRLKNDLTSVKDYIEYAEKKLAIEINNENSNLFNILGQVVKDYFSFGNAGLGVFVSPDYNSGFQRNFFEFLPFSISECSFTEGRNGKPESIFCSYKWSVNRIVKTFCMTDGKLDQELLNKLPDRIKSLYNDRNSRETKMDLAYCLLRNDDWDIDARFGKKACRHMGIYILFEDNFILGKEYFKENPILVVRANKLNGQTYGRSDAANCLSTIKLLNAVTGDAFEASGKMLRPAMALNDGFTEDNVLDVSESALNIITPPSGQTKATRDDIMFPISEMQDPTALISFMIPNLRDSVTKALKSDIFLDFNSRSNMSATESAQRYNIRNKALYSTVMNFANNILTPLIKRCYSVMYDRNAIGSRELLDYSLDEKIPDVIMELQESGVEWFDIEYNSEIYQISKSTEISNMTQYLMTIESAIKNNPSLLQAIDFYEILRKISELFNNSQFLIDKGQYQAMQQMAMQLQSQQAEMQNQNSMSIINKTNSEALKNDREARRTV
jgi:hypothetical protein